MRKNKRYARTYSCSIVYFVINAEIHLDIGLVESFKFMYVADK